MGTATIPNQRSQPQNRKKGPVNSGVAESREDFSPLQAIHGNRVTRSSRRQTAQANNLYILDVSTGKENAAPLPLSKSSEKRKGTGTVSTYSKRLRNRAENANDCSGTNHAAGSPYVANEGSPIKGTGFGTRSNTNGRLCNRQSNSETISSSSQGTNKASAGCKDNQSHEIPSLPPQLGPSSRSNGQDNGNLPKNGEHAISPLSLLQKDYENLYSKYQKLKARKFEEVDSLYEVQKSRITAYVKATEAMINFYKEENAYLRQQVEETNLQECSMRSKWLEQANLECRNDLLLQQSKNFALQQEINVLKARLLERAATTKPCIEGASILPKEDQTDSGMNIVNKEEAALVSSSHSKLMQQLLECLLGLQLCFPGEGPADQLQFHHCLSGFTFNLRRIHDVDVAQLVGGGELMYQNVSLGTLCKKAKDWMKEEEAIFGVAQAQLFFKKLLQFIQQGA